jgi:hypothetical protein
MPELDLLAQIDRKVRQTQQRQSVQRGLAYLPGSVAVALLGAAAYHAAEPWLPWTAAWWLPATLAVVIGTAAALGLAWWRRPTPRDAALALDAAFRLQERIVTVVSLAAAQRASAAGTALMNETQQHLGQVDVASRFPLEWRARAWLAPALAVVAVVVAARFPLEPRAALAKKPELQLAKAEDPLPNLDLKAIKQVNDERRNRIKEIQSEKLNELQAEIDKLIERLDQKDKPAELQLALQDATKVAEQLKNRQEELAKTADNIRKKLQQELGAKDLPDGPAKDLQKALSEGNFDKAKDEMARLLEKLQDNKLSETERKELAKQLGELANKLNDIAQQKAKQEALAKSNADPETKAQEMARLAQELANLKDLQKMADALQKAQQAMKDGKMDAAKEAMEQMAAELQNLNLDMKEMQELAITQEELDEIREGMG